MLQIAPAAAQQPAFAPGGLAARTSALSTDCAGMAATEWGSISNIEYVEEGNNSCVISSFTTLMKMRK
jgi:hypothetical protein